MIPILNVCYLKHISVSRTQDDFQTWDFIVVINLRTDLLKIKAHCFYLLSIKTKYAGSEWTVAL